jgi:hypothetical protein
MTTGSTDPPDDLVLSATDEASTIVGADPEVGLEPAATRDDVGVADAAAEDRAARLDAAARDELAELADPAELAALDELAGVRDVFAVSGADDVRCRSGARATVDEWWLGFGDELVGDPDRTWAGEKVGPPYVPPLSVAPKTQASMLPGCG